MSLAELGTSEVAERLYQALVIGQTHNLRELQVQLDLTPATIESAARELSDLGLVSRSAVDPLKLEALPPGAALEALAAHRYREATAARAAATQLSELWNSASHRSPRIEILTTADQLVSLGERLLEVASSQVRALSLGPTGTTADAPEPAPGVYAVLERRIPVRVVYGSDLFQNQAALAVVSDCIERGEQARVCPTVPFNVTMGDSFALVALGGGTDRVQGLVVHRGDLYDGLAALFEMVWDMAVPITPSTELTDDAALRDASRDLLTCLAAGLTDDSIAVKLGISQRTVARRISVLQEHLAANSRFQLGVQVSRRGWL